MIVFLLLIGATSYYLFRNNEMGKLLHTMKEANPIYLVAGMLFMLIFIISEALSIQVLMKPLKYMLSFWKCLKYSFVGFYFCSITPSSSGGQPAQVYYMKKDGVEVSASSLCVMIVTVAYQIGILLICLFAFVLKRDLIVQNLGFMKYLVIFGIVINFGLFAAFVCATFNKTFLEKAFTGCIRLLAMLKIVKDAPKIQEKMELQISEYRKGADYIKNNPRVLFLVLATVIIQILSRLSVAYAVYKAFGLHGYDYADIITLQAFLALGVEYLPIPGAIGATETGFLSVNKLIFGSDKLMSAMLLSRGISFYAFLIISGCVTLGAHLHGGRRHLRDTDANVQNPKST